MGYTHYWTRSRFEISKADWTAITDDVRRIIAKSPAPICYESDAPLRQPRIDEVMIRFNGRGDDGHETFLIERSIPADERKSRYKGDNRKWSFCKTARKPYDITVTAILAYLDSCWPTLFSVSSDGDPDEWADGLRLATEALPDRKIMAPRELEAA